MPSQIISSYAFFYQQSRVEVVLIIDIPLIQTTSGKDEPNIVNKTWALTQTTGGKDEPNIVIKT
jgi:hypothetical protein